MYQFAILFLQYVYYCNYNSIVFSISFRSPAEDPWDDWNFGGQSKASGDAGGYQSSNDSFSASKRASSKKESRKSDEWSWDDDNWGSNSKHK